MTQKTFIIIKLMEGIINFLFNYINEGKNYT